MLLLTLLVSPAFATALLPGNAAKGKVALDAKCTACHVQMFGGDGSKVFTRKDRKTSSIEGLMGRVKGCNAKTGANLGKDDVDNIVNYLNTAYYKF